MEEEEEEKRQRQEGAARRSVFSLRFKKANREGERERARGGQSGKMNS